MGSYGLQAPGGWWDNSYDQPRTPETVTNNILSEREDVDTSGAGDGWGAWFQNIAGAAIGYAIKKDAAQNGIGVAGVQPTGYPTPMPQSYARQPAGGFTVTPGLLLVGGAILAAVLVLKK